MSECYGNKWRGIQQISCIFFSYFFTFLSALLIEQNFILTDFSLQKSIFVKEQSLCYCNWKTWPLTVKHRTSESLLAG